MQYLCLVHLDGAKLAGLTPEEAKELDRASIEYDAELERAGHYVASAALQDPKTGAIVRPSGAEFSVTDGPFVEIKEHVGCFILIEARDLNEAISVAAKIPVAQFGAVEVRPTLSL